MPIVPLESLPDDSRCWVFGAHSPLDEVDGPRLLEAVDAYLKTWKSHGAPLTCARELHDEFFLVVAVDERASDASGCSIDGLFKVLQGIEKGIGTSMVGGGMVHFRDRAGFIHAVTRHQFELLSREGEVDGKTPAFDTTVTTLGAYRSAFEGKVSAGWQAQLLSPQTRK